MIRSIMVGLSAAFLLLSIGSFAYAAGVTLAWDEPEGETPITGYSIYYGTTSGNHPTKVEAGKPSPLQYTVSGLEDNQTYYFVVKAFNDAGEGPASNEISWSQSDTTSPLPPQGVSVQ